MDYLKDDDPDYPVIIDAGARPTQHRLESLEVQLAHTQRMCEQLNEVVTQISLSMQKRDRILDSLTQQVKDLQQKSGGGSVLENERSPHY